MSGLFKKAVSKKTLYSVFLVFFSITFISCSSSRQLVQDNNDELATSTSPVPTVTVTPSPSPSPTASFTPTFTPTPTLTPTPIGGCGGSILFVVASLGGWDIIRIDTLTKEVRNLTNTTDAEETGPSWRPDGSAIAFASNKDGDYEIYSMDPNGENIQQITDRPDFEFDLAPSWSPDGSKLVFYSRPASCTIASLYIIEADGSNLFLLYGGGNSQAPDWSPDGSKIAFHSNRDGDDEIYVINPDGTGLTQLTSNTAHDALPAWSPEGSKIAFYSDRDGIGSIYVMDANGMNVSKVKQDSRDFDWSPDGNYLVSISETQGNRVQIVNVNNEEDLFTLIDYPGSVISPQWQTCEQQ